MDRIQLLVREIEHHDKLYWIEGNPTISDIDYDKLVNELKSIDPKNPIIGKIHSPLVVSTGKIRHKTKMLSLEKEVSVIKAINWCTKVARSPNEKFILEPKYDGCSVEIYNGSMATRGDGIFGENITNKFKICNVEIDGELVDPKTVDYARGEILFKKSDFVKFNKKFPDKYKTPRNGCGGLLNNDDVDWAGKVLTIVPFDTHQSVHSLTDIYKEKIEEYMNEVFDSDYPADGIVIKLADINYRIALGSSSTHNKWEIAIKFANPTGESVLRRIEWCMGKRTLTPRAHIDPVEIGGVMVTHINLHNYKYLVTNDIHVGDTLIVERAGDVIPDFKSLIPGENRVNPFIDTCPICGFKVDYEDPQLVCNNANCSGQHLMKFMDSVIRIGIERLGKPTLKKIVDTLSIKNLVELFNLTKEDILKLDGFANSSADNLIGEIRKARENCAEWKILSSLNIHGIGTTLSKDLLTGRSLNDLRSMNVEDFKSIGGVGEERARLLVGGLLDSSQYIDLLLETVVVSPTIESNSGGEDLKTICFTGKMPEKRSYYEKLAVENGMSPSSNVNKDLDILVCMDPNSNSNKLKNAKKLGTRVISVEEFLELIREE